MRSSGARPEVTGLEKSLVVLTWVLLALNVWGLGVLLGTPLAGRSCSQEARLKGPECVQLVAHVPCVPPRPHMLLGPLFPVRRLACCSALTPASAPEAEPHSTSPSLQNKQGSGGPFISSDPQWRLPQEEPVLTPPFTQQLLCLLVF